MYVNCIENQKKSICLFKYINPGECFRYGDDIFMRIDRYRNYNALNLSTNELKNIKLKEEVILLEHEITIKGVEVSELKRKETFVYNGTPYMKRGYEGTAFNLITGQMENLNPYSDVFQCTLYIETKE